MDALSQKALKLILRFEGLDQPWIWPGMHSGISLGRGYDLGDISKDRLLQDWGDILDPAQLDRLASAIGLKGTAAKAKAGEFTDIRITEAAADKVFGRDIPRYQQRTADAFRNLDRLHPDAQGALVSLVYNRGEAMVVNGKPRTDMMAVRDAVTNQNVGGIVDALRTMTVLPVRRRAEADLVASTIGQEPTEGSSVSPPPAAGEKASVELLGGEFISFASKFVGLRETVDNRTWAMPVSDGRDDLGQQLANLMQSNGWTPGDAYCAAFAKAVWRKVSGELGSPDEYLKRLGALLSLRVTDGFKRCSDEGLITKEPLPGAIFFMRHGDSDLGHAGIVVQVNEDADSFDTIEGNTMQKAKSASDDRAGDGVFAKTRALEFGANSGLHLLGFVNPIPFTVG